MARFDTEAELRQQFLVTNHTLVFGSSVRLVFLAADGCTPKPRTVTIDKEGLLRGLGPHPLPVHYKLALDRNFGVWSVQVTDKPQSALPDALSDHVVSVRYLSHRLGPDNELQWTIQPTNIGLCFRKLPLRAPRVEPESSGLPGVSKLSLSLGTAWVLSMLV